MTTIAQNSPLRPGYGYAATKPSGQFNMFRSSSLEYANVVKGGVGPLLQSLLLKSTGVVPLQQNPNQPRHKSTNNVTSITRPAISNPTGVPVHLPACLTTYL